METSGILVTCRFLIWLLAPCACLVCEKLPSYLLMKICLAPCVCVRAHVHVHTHMCAESLQSCATFLPMDCNPPGSSINGILQVRKLEWVAILSSRGSSWSRDPIQVSCIAGIFFTFWTKDVCSFSPDNNNWLYSCVQSFVALKISTIYFEFLATAWTGLKGYWLEWNLRDCGLEGCIVLAKKRNKIFSCDLVCFLYC